MALSEIDFTQRLTVTRSVTFFLLLSFTAWDLTFEHNYAVILCVLNIVQLGIEHLLGMVQLVRLSTLDRHRGLLGLNVLSMWAWITYNIFWSYEISQQWISINMPSTKAELSCKWMVVAAFIIHILVGAKQAREEIKKERHIQSMLEDKVDTEEN